VANKIIIRPHKGFQENFVRSNVDVCFGGGALGGGKSFGAVMATVEPSQDPNWRGLFLRNNVDDLKAGGGLIDTFKELYGEENLNIVESKIPRITFPSGAYVDCTHADDQRPEVLDRRFKGRQYDMVYFDEGTGFSWECFTNIVSRCRGRSGFAGKCLLTTNPERDHWIRDFIDWYIGDDGKIIEERSGVVRYFFNAASETSSGSVKDIVWGNSKEEVYDICKPLIDKRLDDVFGYKKGRDKWPALIKSFTFYLGRMSENTDMLERNENYLGSVAMAGGVEAAKKLGGNWNVSSKDNNTGAVTFEEANRVFLNDPQRNGNKWVTCDLADVGTDNVVMIAWNGFHVEDIRLISHSTPAQNADALKIFAAEHDVAYSHIIYDAIRARYINDYIEEAIPFESYRAPMGMYALNYMKLKDECYGKLIYLIKNGGISFDEGVANAVYKHQKLTEKILIKNEFADEASAIHWTDGTSGKKRLMTKKEMNKILGRGRSMDIMDAIAMRMYPCLSLANGYELENDRKALEEDEENSVGAVNIYDDTIWA